MRKYVSIFLTIILLFILNFRDFAQYPKQANIAIVESDSLNGLKLFNQCIKILQMYGYDISSINHNAMSLTTNSYFIHELPLLIYYKLSIEDNIVLVRGYVMNLDTTDLNEISRHGEKWERASFRSIIGTTWRIGFNDMVIVTEKIRLMIFGKVMWDKEKI